MKKRNQKLNINKKTISNLKTSEMIPVIGGKTGSCYRRHCGGGGYHSQNCTQNQNTCPGHNTCDAC